MLNEKQIYKKSIIGTVMVHLIVFSLLAISLRSSVLSPVVSNTTPTIQAVAIDSAAVQSEVQKIKAASAAKQAKEKAYQTHLQQLASEAKQARVQEEKRITALKQKQVVLEKAQAAKAKALATQVANLQKQQAVAKASLDKMHAQKAQASAAQAAAEKSLAQQVDQEQKQMAALQASQRQSEIDHYKALILNAIGQRWIMPDHVDKTLSTELLVHLAPGGTVLSVSIEKSSGNAILDRSVVTAVWKASPLPAPNDQTLFDSFRDLDLTVRPEGLL